MEEYKIGVVTVLYNSECVLEDFFRTLNDQSCRHFILYLIDNNSTDNSVEKGKEYAENVDFECKWFLQKENLGVAEGNNIGIKAALADGCDYVLLANNDIVLDKNTIQFLLDGMLETKATMAVPKIYYWDNPNMIWTAGGGFLWLQFSTYHRGECELDEGQYDERQVIEYAPTCFMLIDAEVFGRVGFMDSRYFVYYDDTDFVWRSVKLGTERLMYIPEARLWHKVSSSTGGSMSDFSIFYSERNHLLFALRYCYNIHFILFCMYLIVHTLLRKPFFYNFRQIKLIAKSYIEGYRLYRKYW